MLIKRFNPLKTLMKKTSRSTKLFILIKNFNFHRKKSVNKKALPSEIIEKHNVSRSKRGAQVVNLRSKRGA